jgi:hypothetical protein
MATRQEEFDALMGRLNTITNDIAADYALLLKQIADGTVSAESIAAGNENVAILEALGASVSNPVPEPPTE